ncbi:MAG: NERD domain-containing protein [Sulfuritalea sp.]|nr:NERD domain-containing protein [Sulfuritalea sp.]
MIFKELDPFQSDDKFAKAGRAAEEQMAFYFKRFFGDDPDILVLNGIRLEANGDAAQVDHLIVHSHGLAVVESKSVHGKVQIKEDGQWIRWYANQSRGMASPITQARLQEKFFRSVLGRAAKNEDLFARLPIDLFIAISDQGVILWPPSGPVSGVCKADQIPDKIIESHQSKVKAGGNLVLSPVNREKIAAFLVANNKPLVKVATEVAEPTAEYSVPAATPTPVTTTPKEMPPTPAEVAPADSADVLAVCRACKSSNLSVQYGKFGYYFKCGDCEGNSPIKLTCSAGHKERIRKDGAKFYRECSECKTSELYFENAVT